jgi:hypothetical protein
MTPAMKKSHYKLRTSIAPMTSIHDDDDDDDREEESFICTTRDRSIPITSGVRMAKIHILFPKMLGASTARPERCIPIVSIHPIDVVIYAVSTLKSFRPFDNRTYKPAIYILYFCLLCASIQYINSAHGFHAFGPLILSVRGNFWSASCDYVRQLIPPNEFAMAQDAMYEALLKMQQQQMNDSDNGQGQQQQQRPQQQQQLPPILLQNDSFWVPRPASLGLGRFANEVWIGSHPDVIPCDVSPATSFTLYKTDTTENSFPEMQFGMLPKRTLDEIVECDDIGNRERKQNVMQNETLRKRDFFLLPGMLFQSSFRYQSLPLNTSWVFDQYPDGPYWRRQVMRMRAEIEPAAQR